MAAETAASAAPSGPVGRALTTGGGIPPPPDTGGSAGDIPAPPLPRDPPNPRHDRPFRATLLSAMTIRTASCRPDESSPISPVCPTMGGGSLTTRSSGTLPTTSFEDAARELQRSFEELLRSRGRPVPSLEALAQMEAFLANIVAEQAEAARARAAMRDEQAEAARARAAMRDEQEEAARARAAKPDEPVRATAHGARYAPTATRGTEHPTDTTGTAYPADTKGTEYPAATTGTEHPTDTTASKTEAWYPSATERITATAPTARTSTPCGGPVPPPGKGAPSGGILPPPAPRGPPDPACVAGCSMSRCLPVAASLTPGARACTGIARRTMGGEVPPRPVSTGARAEHRKTGGNTPPARWAVATSQTIGGSARAPPCSTGTTTTRRTRKGTVGPPTAFPGTRTVHRTQGKEAGKRVWDAGLAGDLPPAVTRVAHNGSNAAFRGHGRDRLWPRVAPDPGDARHRDAGRDPFWERAAPDPGDATHRYYRRTRFWPRVGPDPSNATHRYSGRVPLRPVTAGRDPLWDRGAPDPDSTSRRYSGRVPFQPVADNHASDEKKGGRLAPDWVPHQPRVCRALAPNPYDTALRGGSRDCLRSARDDAHGGYGYSEGCGRSALSDENEDRRVRYVDWTPNGFQCEDGRENDDAWSYGAASGYDEDYHDYSSRGGSSSEDFWGDDSSSSESEGSGGSYWSNSDSSS